MSRIDPPTRPSARSSAVAAASINGILSPPSVEERHYGDAFWSNRGGVFGPLSALGMLLRSFSTEPNNRREVVPLQANTRNRRRTTSLLGAGLVKRFPTPRSWTTLHSKPAQNPQQAGQVHPGDQPQRRGWSRLGPFGWKSQHALLLDFAGTPTKTKWASATVAPFENTPQWTGGAGIQGQLDDQPGANGITDVVRLVTLCACWPRPDGGRSTRLFTSSAARSVITLRLPSAPSPPASTARPSTPTPTFPARRRQRRRGV